jgi:16S rRNA (guanine966-N2)-methyltransferase
VRIVAGRWRGRRIVTPPGEATRPAANAHRESVVGSLGADLSGLRVLDLFAGSGAFSLECLSRGADVAVMVERSADALRTIRENVALLDVPEESFELVAGDAYRVRPSGGPFDVVFVAPPYPHFRGGRLPRLLELVASLPDGPEPLLAEGGVAIVQSEAGDFRADGVAGLRVLRVKRFGRTAFAFLER